MNWKMKGFFSGTLAAISLMAAQAHAALIHQDFKTVGDSKVTYHQETNLSWLKLTNTIGMSLNQVKAQLGVGGVFEGWRLPTDAEVESLALALLSPLSLNEDSTVYNGSGYRGYTATWRTWMGTTYYTSSGESSNGNKHWYSFGLYEGSTGNVEMSGTYYRDQNSFGSHTYYATIYDDYVNGYTADMTHSAYGVYLVKIRPEDLPPAPEPDPLPGGDLNNGGNPSPVPAAGFGALALLGLALRKRLGE